MNWNFREGRLSEVNWWFGCFLPWGAFADSGPETEDWVWPMQRGSTGEKKITRLLVTGHTGSLGTPKYMTGFLIGHLLNSKATHGMLEAKPRTSKRQNEISHNLIIFRRQDFISRRGLPKTHRKQHNDCLALEAGVGIANKNKGSFWDDGSILNMNSR